MTQVKRYRSAEAQEERQQLESDRKLWHELLTNLEEVFEQDPHPSDSKENDPRDTQS